MRLGLSPIARAPLESSGKTAVVFVCQTDSIASSWVEANASEAPEATTGEEKKRDGEAPEEERVDVDYGDLIADLGTLDPDDDDTEAIYPGVSIETPNDIHVDGADSSETSFDVELRFPEPPTVDPSEDDVSVDNLGFETIELPRTQDGNEDESELTLDLLLEGGLPPIDADTSDEPPSEGLELELVGERGNIAWAERRYREAPSGVLPDPYYSFAEDRSVTYAAGKTIIKISNDAHHMERIECVPLGKLEHSVLSLSAMGDDRLLCSTAAGHLVLVDGKAAPRKLTPRFGPPVHSTAFAVTQLVLHGDTLRLLLSDGSILRSDDGGRSFHAEATPTPLLKLATGSRALGLTGNRERPLSVLRRGEWEYGPIASAALSRFLETVDSSTALLGAVDDIVLLGQRDRGIWLSRDGGASFELLVGSSGISALWMGYAAGQPAAFLGTHHAVSGTITVLQLDFDKCELVRVLELEPSPSAPNEDEDGLHALHYQAATQTLWLAGAFGLKRFICEPVQ